MSNDLTTTQLYELLKKSQEEQTEKVLQNFKQLYVKRVEDIEIKCKALEKKYLNTERKLRKNNIVIFGLPFDANNLIAKTITDINTLLDINLTEADVNNCYIIGKNKGKQGILLELISYIKKQEIFKNIGKLKGKKITILNDLSPEDQNQQKILKQHLKTAKENKQQARIKGHLLEIEGKSYTIDQLEEKESEIEEDLEYVEEEEYSEEAETSNNVIIKKKRNKNKNLPKIVKKSSRLDLAKRK